MKDFERLPREKNGLGLGEKLGLAIAFMAMIFAGVQAWDVIQTEELTDAEKARNTIDIVNSEKQSVDDFLDVSNTSKSDQFIDCRNYRNALRSDLSQLRRWYTAGNYTKVIEYELPSSECEMNIQRSRISEDIAKFVAGQDSLNIALGLILAFMMLLAGAVKIQER